MSNLPCIKDKCILYPVCKNKKAIICDLLTEYMFKELNGKEMHSNAIWQYLSNHFPNLMSINEEDKLNE